MRWQGLAAVVLLLLLSGCTGGGQPDAAPAPGVVVASFDFPESELVAEIYAQAIEARGVTVRREPVLGSRELVLPAMRAGLVDVVPEYVGSALDALEPGSAAPPRGDLDAVRSTLARALEPWGLAVLEPAAASNQNVVVVRTETATRGGLRSVSDLAASAEGLVLGGPPECRTRPRCLPGLVERYGFDFAGFEPFGDGELVRRALLDGVVDVGVLFSTDAALADEELTVLVDDRALQPPDNLVPMVRTEVLGGGDVQAALDEVSSALTTEGLRLLNWRLARAGTDPETEARGWLVRHGLVPR